jgi:hypothetical protein
VEEKEVDRRVAGVPWRTEPAAWGRAALQQASRAMSASTGGMLGEDRQESRKQRRGVGYSDGGHREAGRGPTKNLVFPFRLRIGVLLEAFSLIHVGPTRPVLHFPRSL